MDNFEKVEKLRERAQVSYEDAKNALEANNWDLLDAIVSLEKSGKTVGPQRQHYSTSYDQQEEYVSVQKKLEQQKKEAPRMRRTISEAFRNFFRICRDNAFRITRNDREIVRIPLLAAVVILLFTWHVAVPVMLIALLFGVRYSFDGKDDLTKANDLMDSAGAAAENLKESFVRTTRSGNSDQGESADGSEESPERTEEPTESVRSAAPAEDTLQN